MGLRCLFVALLVCVAAATPSPQKDAAVAKLDRMQHSLGALAKLPHAPEGINVLLKDIQHAQGEVQSAQTADAETAVMRNITMEMKTFQGKLLNTREKLQEAGAADTVVKTKELAPIADKLQARLDKIDAVEQKAQKREKEVDERETKMEPKTLDKEGKHTQMLLKYLKKKNSRTFKKKAAKWNQEKKALREAISASKAGKVDKLVGAMKHLTHVEKGDQDFLH